jgi:hypothetical protein
MKFTKGITGVLALAATAVFASALSAQTASLQVLTAGSSAQFGPFAVAAYALATSGTPTSYGHYTVKSGACADAGGGTSSSSTCYAYLYDARNSSTYDIAPEPGNLWVVWNEVGSGTSAVYNVWAYLSVDSTVGVRAFQAYPRAKLTLAAQSSLPLSSTSNYSYWGDSTNDAALPTVVYNALNGTALTAANTDIRPEDALFATNRALNTLGYGAVADPRTGHSGQYLIGYGIESHFNPTTAVAHPVSFSISGADPFNTSNTPPAFVTIPIGAAPIVFIANTSTGSTVASATNITTNSVAASNNAALLFSGTGNCASSLVTGATGLISPILREPLSGTMNTTEYTAFMPGNPSTGYSQETGITGGAPGTTSNPLALPCPSTSSTNYRYRAVGTGDEVNGVIATPNSIGYAFFSYESVGGGKADRYLQLNGIDPLAYTGGSSYTGTLPTCSIVSGAYSCPIAGGASFKNLRNGTYPAWSVYRLITDSTGKANAQTLVSEAESLVDNAIPDFVPFDPQCSLTASGSNDVGLAVYREHYLPSTISSTPNTITITPNDGPRNTTSVACTVVSGSYPHLTLGGQNTAGTNTEAGGDVGGAIQGPFTKSSLPSVPGVTETSSH